MLMFHRNSALVSPSLPPWPGLVILQVHALQEGGRRLLDVDVPQN